MPKPFVRARVLSWRTNVWEKAPRQQFLPLTSTLGWLRTLPFRIGWIRQRRQPSDLSELNSHLLKDIGVSQDDSLHESAESFWR
jgi:uncharacterized protein YjiS (DUF1127 family)